MDIDNIGDGDPAETIRILRQKCDLLKQETRTKLIAKTDEFQKEMKTLDEKLQKAQNEIKRHFEKTEILTKRNEVLEQEKKTLIEQCERTKRARIFSMQQKVVGDGRISEMMETVEHLKADNKTKELLILKQKEEIVLLKRKPREVKLMDYDDLKSNRARRERIQKAFDYVKNLSGLGSKLFYTDLLNKLERAGVAKLKLSPEEGLQLYHSANLTRGTYKTTKRILKEHNLFDPFPPVQSIVDIEEKLGSNDVFSVYESKGVKDEEKVVVVAYLNDVAKTVSSRIEELIRQEKLTCDFDRGLWLTIMGDKGGNEMKICLAIGNVETPNSCHNLIPLGIFNDEESSEALLKHIPTVIDQLNNLKELKIKVNEAEVVIPVELFLGGDMKFQYDMLGHQGASAMSPCMYCVNRGRIKIRDYKRGEIVSMRTEESYAAASAQGNKKVTVESVKAQSSFVFKGVRLENVLIPSLHSIMGIAQGYGFDNLLLWATVLDCDDETIVLNKADIKQGRVQKSNILQFQEVVSNLDTELRSMVVLQNILQNFQNSTIDGTDEREESACSSEICFMRDRLIEKAPLFDDRHVKCASCEETIHAACCGVWNVKEWKLTNDSTIPFQCLLCSNVTGVGIDQLVTNEVEFLKNELKMKIDELNKEQVRFDSMQEALRGKKKYRQELERIWKKWGADMSVWRKTFCGNHIYNILREEAIDEYMSIFKDHKHFESMKRFLKSLGKLQRLCVPRLLSPAEMDYMENAIDTMWASLREFAADDNVTPKLHAVLEHLMPFVRSHRTWAKTSEQPIEAFHAAYNTAKLRYRTNRNEVLKAQQCFKRCLINNHVFDVS
ncbi:hypothetical protein GCK72_012107 [Caenorhabditis remanei]|uniref:Zinc finger PHD-type domain-containing protein n=1 Tax=Caenorhabditis remanei TaxID=31234 RepID=A0A6A5GK18_CAERE|nr:hypothetical protein GCK72_012107 [Caenorhabditis remanei]KAF1755657.1 hypothetical protein GCK72_012107 [Caenorhabditis remanei]